MIRKSIGKILYSVDIPHDSTDRTSHFTGIVTCIHLYFLCISWPLVVYSRSKEKGPPPKRMDPNNINNVLTSSKVLYHRTVKVSTSRAILAPSSSTFFP